MLPEPLDEIQVGAVVRQPKDLQMLFDIFQVLKLTDFLGSFWGWE